MGQVTPGVVDKKGGSDESIDIVVRFITAGEPEYTTVDATEGEKSFGRTWYSLVSRNQQGLGSVR